LRAFAQSIFGRNNCELDDVLQDFPNLAIVAGHMAFGWHEQLFYLAGGVVAGITNGDTLRQAFEALGRMTGFQGVLIEEMLTGIELIIV
jgi:predicted TIM-barrel fold metal-dependent hydrolase